LAKSSGMVGRWSRRRPYIASVPVPGHSDSISLGRAAPAKVAVVAVISNLFRMLRISTTLIGGPRVVGWAPRAACLGKERMFERQQRRGPCRRGRQYAPPAQRSNAVARGQKPGSAKRFMVPS
jgi:hypothetical protein